MKNQKLHRYLFLIISFLVCSISSNAQIKQSRLVKGTEVSTSIKAGEIHNYSISLNEKQFAFIRLIQKGVDIVIKAYDPDGNKIGDFDSPNGKNGPELISFNSDKKGNYLLEIRPIDEKETGGDYVISIIKTEPVATTPEKKVDQLFTQWDNSDTPGASVAFVKEGKIIFKKGYGSANLEYDIPVVPSTIFHIASVSKQFTAFSVLLLAREGKLSLDDDIRKYIPEVPDFGNVVTLRHLAHHTSGLRDQWNLLAMAGWRLDDVITKEHILKLVARQKELNFIPGDEYLYCNTGFTLLAEVVARVSGKTFAEFTRERIFLPLGMKNTLFYDDHEKIVKNRAYSYHQSTGGYKKSVLSYANAGATSLFTTVEDLSLWAMNFENPVIGDKIMMNEMNTRGILNKGDTISYALGQIVRNYKGLNTISHDGADAGYRTSLVRFPDQKCSVIVFSNDASFNAGDMALKIADIFLKEKISIEQPVKKEDSPVTTLPFQVNIDTLKSFCGQYELQPGTIVSITREDDKLFAEAPGFSKTILFQVSSSEFTIKGTDTKLTFIKDENNRINRLKAYLSGQEAMALRLQDFDPASVDFTQFTGEFYSPELSTSYSFVIMDKKLIARHNRLSDFTLTPVKPDNFSSDQWYFSQIEFVRDEMRNIKGCRVSSGRVRNLWFQKMNN